MQWARPVDVLNTIPVRKWWGRKFVFVAPW